MKDLTIVKVDVPSLGRSMEKELPFAGIPVEWLEGFSTAANMLDTMNVSYTVTINVKRER